MDTQIINGSIIQGKTTRVQYFDNGLSDNSDEEIETVNHLTCVNKVQPVRSEPKTQTSISSKTEHRNIKGRKDKSPLVANLPNVNYEFKQNKPESVRHAGNKSDGRVYHNEVQSNGAVGGPVYFNNDIGYGNSDEDDDLPDLTIVNNVRSSPCDRFENTNAGRDASKSRDDENLKVNGHHNVKNGNNSHSTTSSMSSYFDNDFHDESDDERDISLTYNNHFQNRKDVSLVCKNPRKMVENQNDNLDILRKDRTIVHQQGQQGVYFNNGSDDDEDDDDYLELLNCKNKLNCQKPLQKTVQLSGPHIDRRNEQERKATGEKIEFGNIPQIITQQNNNSISLDPQSKHVTSRQMNNPENIQQWANTEDGVLVSRANETSIVDSKSEAIDKCNTKQDMTVKSSSPGTKLPQDLDRKQTDGSTCSDEIGSLDDVKPKDAEENQQNQEVNDLKKSNSLFHNMFESKGLRPAGKNLFEVRLGENTLDTHDDINFLPVNKSQPKPEVLETKTDHELNTQIMKGEYFGENDNDLEIDGEKSRTIKANFAKRWDPLKEKEKKLGIDSANQQQGVTDEYTKPFDRTKQDKKKTSFTRQLSHVAYSHTCSGCGRKDCDGNFMKLLREMIKTGRQKGFEIRNVVPDGNCMFAAVVDQLELLRDYYISPFALRQSCVQFLKSTPTSQDGTPFYLFLDGESWEDYLSRIGQEGQWGDHLMLQAISSVTKRKITIINGSDENKWTTIQPIVMDPTKPEAVHLGHVGELHYVSMRPVVETEVGEDELMSLDLYSLMPSLPNIEDSEQQEMFNEDYIDPWSDIPAIHLSFLIKQFIPLKATIKNADSMCHQAFAIESSTDEFMSQKSSAVQHTAIGDVVEGLFASSLDNHGQPESQLYGEWGDVGIICSLCTCIAYPKNMMNEGTIGLLDLTVDNDHTHPGYVRLLARYPDTWDLETNSKSTKTLYIPNTHKRFKESEATKRFKDQYANHNPAIVYLFERTFSGIFSPFWPEEASAWRRRSRDVGWPSPGLIDSIVSEGVYYISLPRTNSSNPGIEFQTCFSVAERRLANEGLSKDQRYCFIVFKALVSHALMGNELINSTHLKSIFFGACEQIPEQYWTSRLGGCILYMMDSLIRQLGMGNVPNYFIQANNMIDHLSRDDIEGILDKIRNLRINPVSSLYSIAYQNMVMNADEIYQQIRFDIDDFHVHRSVRQSVIGSLVPTKIKMAATYIEANNFDTAIEIIQEAHEDRLMVSTCEDNIPFVAFVTEVTNSFGLSKQWWLCLHADETLGTTLSTDLSLQHNPIPLKELVGIEIGDRYGELLIPRPLAENLFTFCHDFYLFLSSKHRKKKAVSFLVKGREFFFQLQQVGMLPDDFPCTINTDDHNIANIYKIYKSIVQNFVMTVSSEPLFNFRLDEISQEVQSVCEKVNSEEAYTILALMWKFLGDTEKCNQASCKLEEFATSQSSH